MARYEFKLPDIGEGIAEAEIVAWHVKVGDKVEEDQQLADMMTDKATVEMESPVAGKVLEVAGEVGDQIAIGSVLVVIETEGEAAGRGDRPRRATEEPLADGLVEVAGGARGRGRRAPRPRTAAATTAASGEDRRAEPRDEPDRAPGRAAAPTAERRAGPTPGEAEGFNPQPDPPKAQVLASPAVRAARPRSRHRPCAGEDLPATAIRHADLDAYLLYSGGARRPRRRRRGARTRTVKVVGLRRRIAENMQEAKRRIPHFTYVEEVRRHRARADPRDDERRPRRQSQADPAALPDHRHVPGARRLSADQRPLRRRRASHHTARARSIWAWRPRPTTASRSRSSATPRAATSGTSPARSSASPRRPAPARRRREELSRLDHHHLQPRPDGRHRLDAGDQPARSRDHRRQQGRGEAGRGRRRARDPQADEPVAVAATTASSTAGTRPASSRI